MKIDIHAHIVERRYIEELTEVMGLTTAPGRPGQMLLRRDGLTYAWYREDMFDIDNALRVMDDHGIEMRVLSLSAPNVYVWDRDQQIQVARRMNDATATVCRAHPDRFAGFASLPLADADASLVELDRAVDELDMVGVTIGSNIDGRALNEGFFEPIWARVNERRLPVFEHPMFSPHSAGMEEFELPLRVGFVFDTTLVATRLIYAGIFERYPDFPYILAHTGGTLPMVLERLDNGYRLFPDCSEHITKLPSEFARNFYYDTCAFFEPALMMARELFGSDHLLWGTDNPFIAADSAHVEALPIPDNEKAEILGGNAARLLGLER